MIDRPPTRRAVVAGAMVGVAALSGCSVRDLTTRKVEDPQAADRARIEQARDLSVQVRTAIADALARAPHLTASLAGLAALHDRQIATFTHSAQLSAAPRIPAPTTPIGTPTLTRLQQREHDLAQFLRSLALGAERGDVAALLASAAAGIDQALAR